MAGTREGKPLVTDAPNAEEAEYWSSAGGLSWIENETVQDRLLAPVTAKLRELAGFQPGQRVLDACAAPGGKSLHILETEPNIDELTLVDFPERMPRLRENFQRAGLHATMFCTPATFAVVTLISAEATCA